MKKMFLKISKNSQENNCARVSFLIKDIEKEAGTGASYEFWEISKNTFFTEYLLTTASAK